MFGFLWACFCSSGKLNDFFKLHSQIQIEWRMDNFGIQICLSGPSVPCLRNGFLAFFYDKGKRLDIWNNTILIFWNFRILFYLYVYLTSIDTLRQGWLHATLFVIFTTQCNAILHLYWLSQNNYTYLLIPIIFMLEIVDYFKMWYYITERQTQNSILKCSV